MIFLLLLVLQIEEAGGRYEIFIKRLELSSDPQAKEYLRATNAQMLEGGKHQMFVNTKVGRNHIASVALLCLSILSTDTLHNFKMATAISHQFLNNFMLRLVASMRFFEFDSRL
jgi:hypothetical protein